MVRSLSVMLLLVVAFGLFAQDGSEAVITVNGEKITKDEFLRTTIFFNGPAVIEYLIRTKLFCQFAKKMGVKVDPKKVEEEARRFVERYSKTPHGKKQLSLLEKLGFSKEEFFKLIRENVRLRLLVQETVKAYRLTEKFLKERFEQLFPKNETLYHVMLIRIHKNEKIHELKREADNLRRQLLQLQKAIMELQKPEKEGVLLTDKLRQQIKEFLKNPLKKRLTPEEAKEVLEKAKGKAEDLRHKIDALDERRRRIEGLSEKEYVQRVKERLQKEPFEQVAREEAVGWLRFPEGYDPGYSRLIGFKKELRPVITSLKVSQISEPVKTVWGYFFVKLVDRKAPGELKFEDVRDQLVRRYKNMPVYDQEIEQLAEKLEKEAKIELNLGAILGAKRPTSRPQSEKK